jgi:hypothetical protein
MNKSEVISSSVPPQALLSGAGESLSALSIFSGIHRPKLVDRTWTIDDPLMSRLRAGQLHLGRVSRAAEPLVNLWQHHQHQALCVDLALSNSGKDSLFG